MKIVNKGLDILYHLNKKIIKIILNIKNKVNYYKVNKMKNMHLLNTRY